MRRIVINGEVYTGNNVTVNNDTVIIDGECKFKNGNHAIVNVEITGDAEKK